MEPGKYAFVINNSIKILSTVKRLAVFVVKASLL